MTTFELFVVAKRKKKLEFFLSCSSNFEDLNDTHFSIFCGIAVKHKPKNVFFKKKKKLK